MIENGRQIARLVRYVRGRRPAGRTELPERKVDRSYDVPAAREMLGEVRFSLTIVLQRMPVDDERVARAGRIERGVAHGSGRRRHGARVPHLDVEDAKRGARERAVRRRGARIVGEMERLNADAVRTARREI